MKVFDTYIKNTHTDTSVSYFIFVTRLSINSGSMIWTQLQKCQVLSQRLQSLGIHFNSKFKNRWLRKAVTETEWYILMHAVGERNVKDSSLAFGAFSKIILMIPETHRWDTLAIKINLKAYNILFILTKGWYTYIFNKRTLLLGQKP